MTKFKAPEYPPVPPGKYPGRFEGTEERQSERGDYTRFGFGIVEGKFAGRMVYGNTSLNFGPRAKARKWLEAMQARRIEPGEEVDPDDLVGEVYTIRVENSAPDSQGRVFDNVADVLGPVDDPDEEDFGHTSV